MKQNSDNIRGILNGQTKLPQITVDTREFNQSNMPNLLDTNKIKDVRVFDSVCANVVRSNICSMC